MSKIDARIISREARKDFAQIQRTVADYNEMIEDCREQGFRPQYCIHGTNQWTDYDNICNGCEHGDLPQYMTYSDVLRDTLDDYRRTMVKVEKVSKDLASPMTQLYRMTDSPEASDLVFDLVGQLVKDALGLFA